jgi:hypothetical protein
MISFWVFPSTVTHGSVSSVAKSVANDATKVQISPGTAGSGCYDGTKHRFVGTTGTVTTENGGITKVVLYARAFRSAQGPDNWCSWSDARLQNENAFIALFCDWDKNGSEGQTNHLWESWHNYLGYQIFSGTNMVSYFHNFNTGGSVPADSKVKKYAWDITSKASWDNARLSNLRIGFAYDKSNEGVNYTGGWPLTGGASNTPRWNYSQLALYVEANDPPIPFASSTFFLGG